jgi:hypothetical protein
MQYYKCAKLDGWDFYTGNTINYRANIGKTVTVPTFQVKNREYAVCSSSVLHASQKPLDALSYAQLPCSVYLVEGQPVAEDADKCGFTHLTVLSEISQNNLDELFGFKFLEACSPVHPLKSKAGKVGKEEIMLLKQWASVWDSVRSSVRASVGASVGDSVWDSVGASVWDSVRSSVRDSVWDSVWDSVRDSVMAYIGSLFPNIKKWKYKPQSEGYLYQALVDLWRKGFVPTFDGETWRLHTGEKAKVVYKVSQEKLRGEN